MAVTLNPADLEAAIGADRDGCRRVLPVVVALVDDYAPEAPEAVANEAAIRAAGWLCERPSGGVLSEKGAEVETRYSGTMGALRASGAMALLSPWKVRRAGVCE